MNSVTWDDRTALRPEPWLVSAPWPVLIGCSHGTSDAEGRRVIRALLDDVRDSRPDLDVREAFVDVQSPAVADVVNSVVASTHSAFGCARDAVVVPLLLSEGYHVGVDIAEAVADRGPGTGQAVAAAPLGPDPRLVAILLDRLAQAGVEDGDAVVLAAAGSSRPESARDVECLADALRRRHPGPVTVGYGSIAKPSVPDAVAAARADLAPGRRVVVASYLLAPGYFLDRLLEAGADAVTAALAPDPRLTELVIDRFIAASEGVQSR